MLLAAVWLVLLTWDSFCLSCTDRVRGGVKKGMDIGVSHRALPLLLLQIYVFDFNHMAVPRSSSWPNVSRVHTQGVPFLVIWNSDCLKLLSQCLSSNANNHCY